MGCLSAIDSRDGALIQIVDAALTTATRKGGAWVACRRGCTECCMGPFPITQLDARRLQSGLARLEEDDPERAARVRERACRAVERMAAEYPGDPSTGILDESPEGEARFETFAEDEPCPALDPDSGLCDLYEWRPVTCRAFGPALRFAGGMLAICELCFRGATDAEIASCAVAADFEEAENELLEEMDKAGAKGQTLVAFALK